MNGVLLQHTLSVFTHNQYPQLTTTCSPCNLLDSYLSIIHWHLLLSSPLPLHPHHHCCCCCCYPRHGHNNHHCFLASLTTLKIKLHLVAVVGEASEGDDAPFFRAPMNTCSPVTNNNGSASPQEFRTCRGGASHWPCETTGGWCDAREDMWRATY